MKHFKAFKEYMDDATARLCIFDRTFKPWKKWENVNLTNLNPCKDCPISKELSENGHYYQICGGRWRILRNCVMAVPFMLGGR